MKLERSLKDAAALTIPLLGVVAVVVWAAAPFATGPSTTARHDDPRSRLPRYGEELDHSAFFASDFADGPAVTRRCLECHEKLAHEFMKTVHWLWHGDPVSVPDHEGQFEIGKKNLINNFCGGIQSNWPRCTSCHAGYGWRDDSFDFDDPELVDCLVCHDTSGTYFKSPTEAGHPAKGVDLLVAARSVGRPTRRNCGVCHFLGGGGDAVKHGDMDGSMYFPSEGVDVHMGPSDLECIDCHRTMEHRIPGRSISVSVSDTSRVHCVDCHEARPHGNQRLDDHTSAVACQTCHIPFMARRAATKMSWDWSTAGQDLKPADPHLYSKKKGTFTYAKNVAPEYYWYNGKNGRYLPGDTIDPGVVTILNQPLGGVDDPEAKIWPFKVHTGKQIYDAKHLNFIVPKTFGEGGYWSDFDWDQAARLGSEAAGQPYSGSYAFAPTAMYWPLSHMVQPAARALQCTDCHRENGRMDWKALGYTRDPVRGGGRRAAGGGAK